MIINSIILSLISRCHSMPAIRNCRYCNYQYMYMAPYMAAFLEMGMKMRDHEGYDNIKWQLGRFNIIKCWCRDMEMPSILPTLCEGNPLVISGSPHKGPVMQSVDVLFDGSLNKLLNKCEWLVTGNAMILMWRHCNDHMICTPAVTT